MLINQNQNIQNRDNTVFMEGVVYINTAQWVIGKSTDFDDGKNHTIETKIINNNEIIFDEIDWGYIKKRGKGRN